MNTKAVAGCKVFGDPEDRATFLRMLASEIQRSKWTCLGYSVMTTHYHLLIRLQKTTLSSGLQHLNATFAKSFNRTYGRRGALWQRRFHDVLIQSDGHLLETSRYIALNAWRVNMCPRPEDYPDCHYGAAIGAYPPDPLVDEAELLRLFGPSAEVARRRLQEFVEESDPRRRRSQTLLRDVSETAEER